MARKRNGVSKSEEVRQLIKANPQIKAKEAIASMAEKGMKISANLFYMVKGEMKGRKQKAKKLVTKVAEATGTPRSDALHTILKVKSLAKEVGGMSSLRALIDALSE